MASFTRIREAWLPLTYSAFIIVYDITYLASFTRIREAWLPLTDSVSLKDTYCVIQCHSG
ncbi:unnamed protein product [Schistocephalus solidus]|uniref:Uncharacterized protein n=1 Tax=Schistocephalus solidus TaxID=70667 RepID=A0A3P7DB02_SCHSO|nr:unnamed protein product [Schistocephalus solidus]